MTKPSKPKRHAVYSGTRNLYEHMVPAVKSLVANSSVTDVWLLIEDEEFPYEMPDFVHFIDLSGQEWFEPGGPNMRSEFTYMAMVRVAYAEIFPDIDRIVQLDVDTVCVDDVDYLWEVDLDDMWLACVEEHLGTYRPFGPHYFNVGVAAFNLDQIRADNVTGQMVEMLNVRKLWCVEQDTFNIFAVPGKMAELPVRYNECFVTGYTDNPAVVHFAGARKWWDDPEVPRREHLAKYRAMSWDEVMEAHDGR